MSTTINIDGSVHTGNYRCECDCGATWNGQGEQSGIAFWSPALPVAESVVHNTMCHSGREVRLVFTDRFERWLTGYWERDSARRAAGGQYTHGSLEAQRARHG